MLVGVQGVNLLEEIIDTKLKPGSKMCKCATCKEYFTSPGGFDKHRKNFKCVPPESVGLIQNEAGVWKIPGGERWWINDKS